MNYELNQAEDRFLEAQARSLLHAVDEELLSTPPQLPEPTERKLALLILDGVLHEEAAPRRPAVQLFFHSRIERAILEMERHEAEEGARIWKLYNHGFVIRTGTATLGFDLVRGTHMSDPRFALQDEAMQRLVDQCDILFISHQHGDHTDKWVAQAFVDVGKPVVTPPTLWEEDESILHLPREAQRSQDVAIQDGEQHIQVVVYPGHHGSDAAPVNNVYLVTTPEQMGFCHTGDQASESSFEWIDEVRNHHRVDVLMPNCWTTDIVRMLDGINPQLVITGHENELEHTVDHREPYWLSYERKTGSDRWGGSRDIGYPHPLLLMTWGESYCYLPDSE